MKRDNKKALYESIMASVAKEVKKALNEGEYSIDNNSDLSNIISTIEVLEEYGKLGRKKRVLYTGVILQDGNLINICYPLQTSSHQYHGDFFDYPGDYVDCGSSGWNLNYHADAIINIRPATNDEIKRWRNAEGIAKSLRKKANTIERVKQINQIRIKLDDGEKIIQSLNEIQ